MATMGNSHFNLNADCEIVFEAGAANNVFYRKWSTGLIEQWGTLSVSHLGGELTVNFGIPFLSTVYKVIMSQPQRGATSSGAIWRPRIGTESAFVVRMDFFNTDGLGIAHTADWYAYGY